MTDAGITLVDDWRSGQRCPLAKRRFFRRSLAAVDTVCVHATAVKGGFGVASEMHTKLAADVVSSARRARYRATPYHGLYSPRDRASVVQWPAADFTYHGNSPNRVSLGWAYDGLFSPDHSDELDVEGGRASLRHLITAALEQGCPLRRVTAHAQHANKPHDPGPRVWLEVVEPVADEFGLGVALDWVTGNGRDEIDRWRRAYALGVAS
jgi:hypothetical protein